jgi:hypothetical protein
MLGGLIDRVNYLIRRINFRVFIGSPGMNNVMYRMCEDRWWAGQDEVTGGWFGVFTRITGWRWIQVFPAKTVDTAQKRDPVAYDNNCAVWDIDWIAVIPYYSKPSINTMPWQAVNAGAADANGFYHGVLAVPNRADMQSYVKFLVTGDNAGTCIVQDNNSGRMVTLPPIFRTDGDVLVDTDPIHKTLVAQNDPQPNEFYAINSASGLLDFFLQGNTTAAHEALWLRGYVRFLYNTPPYSVAQLHVMHTNPGAQIVAQLPQRFKRSHWKRMDDTARTFAGYADQPGHQFRKHLAERGRSADHTAHWHRRNAKWRKRSRLEYQLSDEQAQHHRKSCTSTASNSVGRQELTCRHRVDW